MFDFTTETFSSLISIFSAVIGLGYPVLLQSIQRIDEQYCSVRLAYRFQQEISFKFFQFILFSNIIISILSPFVIYLLPVDFSNYVVSVQTVFILALLLCSFNLFNIIRIYYYPKDLITRLEKSSEELKPKDINLLQEDENNKYVNEQAYTDALTGVANKAAYKEYVDKLDKRAADEKIKYAVVVMDINNLKKINDNFGHEFGDMLIRDASRLIQKGFKDHIVYRIGGDEFVIIIEQAEKAICDELLRNFDDGIVVFNKNNTKYEQKIQIARGIAFYEPDCIDSFASVFREADHAMYENKVMQKSMQTAPPAAGQS